MAQERGVAGFLDRLRASQPVAAGASARVASRVTSLVRSVADTALQSDLDRRISSMSVKLNAFGNDPFGFDPTYLRTVVPPLALVYRNYFRCEATGLENIPEGRCLVVANHAGQVPLDGIMIGLAMFLDRTPPRFPRAMVEKWVQELPVLSWFFPRMGQVTGTPENCRRLLENEEAILVFPEGVRGIMKTYDRRYQLAEFGTGFMTLALEYKTPIVPVAVVGSEEQYPAVFNFKALGSLLGLPEGSFPVTPTFPLLGPLGALPLPVKYRIEFGAPLRFDAHDPDDPDDLEQKVRFVRGTIQSMLDRGVRQRKHIFF